MHPLIEQHREQIVALCERHHVKWLDVFGSITSDEFDPQRSDLDFLVEFEPLEPTAYADAYFGLWFGLEDLCHRKVDLVVERAIRNQRFRRGVEKTRASLYAA